jgi:membrane protein required for colicin V production
MPTPLLITSFTNRTNQRDSALNIFDYVIAAIVIYCVIRGIFRGIIKEASSIIGVLAGLYAAYTYHPNLSQDLAGFKNLFPTGEYLNIISFLILFSVVFLMVGALGILIRYLLKIVFMSWVDKVFGGVFGFIRGFLIASMLVLVLTTFLPSGATVIRESVFCPYVSVASIVMSRFAGNAMRYQFNEKMGKAKKSWDDPDYVAPVEEKQKAASTAPKKLEAKPDHNGKSSAKKIKAAKPKTGSKKKITAKEKKVTKKTD